MVNLFIARDGTVCKNKEEVEEHNKKLRAKEAKSGIVYIDYRFVVKAKDATEASEKVSKFLPDANDEIWYTEAHWSYKKRKEERQKEINRLEGILKMLGNEDEEGEEVRQERIDDDKELHERGLDGKD